MNIPRRLLRPSDSISTVHIRHLFCSGGLCTDPAQSLSRSSPGLRHLLLFHLASEKPAGIRNQSPTQRYHIHCTGPGICDFRCPCSPNEDMKFRSNINSGLSNDLVRMRAWRLDSVNGEQVIPSSCSEQSASFFTTASPKPFCEWTEPQLICFLNAEAPRLALDNVETKMNMGQFNGLLRDHTSPDRLSNGLQKRQASPVLSSGPFIVPSEKN